VPSLEMYQQAFGNGRYGIAAAYGVLLFIVALVLTALSLRFVRSSAAEGGS